MISHYHAELYQPLLVNTSTLAGVLGMWFRNFSVYFDICYVDLMIRPSLFTEEHVVCKLKMASLHQLQVQLDTCHNALYHDSVFIKCPFYKELMESNMVCPPFQG